MSKFQKQFDEVQDLLRFNDITLVVKRVIDFTLDTEQLAFYKKTYALLDWLDTNPQPEEVKLQIDAILQELHSELIAKPEKATETIVVAEHVKKAYGAHGFTLGPVNLVLHEGDIVGLVGENGNGKTTLLRLLCGELAPSGGSLQYNFKYADLYELRTKLVYIPQRTDTWYGGMFDNLVFTASSYGYKPEENNLIVELIIARLGLRKFRKHSWKDLSSGYKMRFELARMLLRKPKILLIDEPLANLDILAQQTVLEDFRAIAKSPFRPIGIVLSSQQLYEVEKTSDQVIFLKQGIQKNLHENIAKEEGAPENPLVIEFESTWTQGALNGAFAALGLISLTYNGGTYIVTLPGTITVNAFLNAVIAQDIPLGYFRDISNSTRRFFVS